MISRAETAQKAEETKRQTVTLEQMLREARETWYRAKPHNGRGRTRRRMS